MRIQETNWILHFPWKNNSSKYTCSEICEAVEIILWIALISLGYGFLRVLPALCNNHLATGMYLLGVKIALLDAKVNSCNFSPSPLALRSYFSCSGHFFRFLSFVLISCLWCSNLHRTVENKVLKTELQERLCKTCCPVILEYCVNANWALGLWSWLILLFLSLKKGVVCQTGALQLQALVIEFLRSLSAWHLKSWGSKWIAPVNWIS